MGSGDADATNQLFACLAKLIQLLLRVPLAKESRFLWSDDSPDVSCQLLDRDDLVRREFGPRPVDLDACGADELVAVAAEFGGAFSLALFARGVRRLHGFLERVSDVEQVVDVEGSLEARNSAVWQCGELAAVGALHGLPLGCLTNHRLKALRAEDVKAVQELGGLVGVETDCTGELLVQFLDG